MSSAAMSRKCRRRSGGGSDPLRPKERRVLEILWRRGDRMVANVVTSFAHQAIHRQTHPGNDRSGEPDIGAEFPAQRA
jgi:hypothetical protein